MEFFVQQLVAGLTSGSIYACVALGLVMIYVSTDHINFAQGEMAMFATYIAWAMINAGLPYWVAFGATILIAFAGGLFIQRVILKPLEAAPVLSLVVCFIALLSIFNALAGMIWSYTIKQFPTPFPARDLFGSGLVSVQQIGVVGVTLLMLGLLTVFFHYTTLGLAMRAAAQNAASARMMGIRVSWMLALGWGLAAAIGAVAGMLVAPIVFLDPNMMTGILVYGFAGALVGGIGSPFGAVIGGFIVGVLENLVGSYIIGNELKLTFALVIVVGVLLVKPAGLFGRVVVRRV
ncbi:branched-chain amino acid ABC transporter permease [Rhodopila sp.]|jgi:branched-chain amino acid transport system permease protein|uniref:branched-chain amino acid ABC transporter permease n=1 Tax=Rhodopila sp. TaxID=2480087 RepID=UPI002D119CF7|nr:branched-chain amino acid ABC transporter permease [Rhodopila sp.]HVZ06435.1 branched-chain amino acid ABC transporter permease [Rhodopila sp.]